MTAKEKAMGTPKYEPIHVDGKGMTEAEATKKLLAAGAEPDSVIVAYCAGRVVVSGIRKVRQ